LHDLRLSGGDLWTLGAGLSWATYTVCLRLRPAGMDAIAFLTVIVALGLAFLCPFYLIELAQKGGFSLSWASLGSIGYVCLFPSVLSFVFWNQAVSQVGASRAGIFIHLMPVFSIVLAILFLGESLAGFHIVGMVLIFGGIALTTVPATSS
jgi:drug/metabolite transporter (DMT)-like permease